MTPTLTEMEDIVSFAMSQEYKVWNNIIPIWESIKVKLTPVDLLSVEKKMISGIPHIITHTSVWHFVKDLRGSILPMQGYVN